jgi:hypothetical protein
MTLMIGEGRSVTVKAPERKFKLGIGLPCTWSHVPFPFFISFIAMERPEFIVLPATNGPIDGMRNKIVEDAKRSGCSHLLMMDVDQVYPVDTVTRLLSHNKMVVGCLVHRRYPPFDPLVMRGSINHYETIEEWEDGDLIEVDATGTGCLMFDMKIFEDMPAPWFRFRENPDPSIPGGVGEDIGFCSDLRERGYKIYVDTGVKCGHLSTLQVTKETYDLYKAVKRAQSRQS